MKNYPDLLDAAEVAEYFNISERRARALIQNRHKRFGIGAKMGQSWIVHRDDLDLLRPDEKYQQKGEQEMNDEKKTISVQFSDAGLWGQTDPEADGYDGQASADAFAEHLENFLYDAYPDAEITITHGIDDRVEVNSDTAHSEVDWVNQIVEKVWNDQPWNVEAD